MNFNTIEISSKNYKKIKGITEHRTENKQILIKKLYFKKSIFYLQIIQICYKRLIKAIKIKKYTSKDLYYNFGTTYLFSFFCCTKAFCKGTLKQIKSL